MRSNPTRLGLVARIWTGFVALSSVAIGFALPLDGRSPSEVFAEVSWLVLPLLFTALGALIVARQPGNRISWILLAIGGGALIDSLAKVLLRTPPPKVTVVIWLAILASNTMWLVIFLGLFNLLYVFPGGRLLSARWRWVYWAEGLIVATVVLVGITAGTIGPSSDGWSIPNPVGVVDTDFFDGAIEVVFGLVLFTVVGGAFGAMLTRWRRAPVLVRTQLKWVLYASVLFIMGYSVSFALSGWVESGVLINLFFVPSIAAIPIAITVAILRYRLFEIDRIVSRTVAYSVVIGLLVAVYVQSVTLLTRVLPLDSDLAVAVSTLAVAALFAPVRRRVQLLVDRRFNRTTYVADNELEQFTNRLKETTDAVTVESELLDVTWRTLQPQVASVWIKPAADRPRA